jgi:hypothetical protein
MGTLNLIINDGKSTFELENLQRIEAILNSGIVSIYSGHQNLVGQLENSVLRVFSLDDTLTSSYFFNKAVLSVEKMTPENLTVIQITTTGYKLFGESLTSSPDQIYEELITVKEEKEGKIQALLTKGKENFSKTEKMQFKILENELSLNQVMLKEIEKRSTKNK